MKYIRKGKLPHVYADWCACVAGTNKEDYRELPRLEKQALLTALMQEQGALCAYTMRNIDESSSHIEHIKPETRCRKERRGLDLDYANLIACYPREGMRKRHRYGAQYKDDWWENDGALFVSPLHPNCETRFRFDMDGKIVAVRKGKAAVTTIRVLALNHSSLQEDRKRVMEEFLYGAEGDSALSRAQAGHAKARICSRDGGGKFREFCVAIRDALDTYLKVLRELARRQRLASGRT